MWYHDGDVCLESDIDEGVAACHCEVYCWNKEVYKKLKTLAIPFFKHFELLGYVRVFAAFKEANDHTRKFAERFGFSVLKNYRGNVIMVKELCHG